MNNTGDAQVGDTVTAKIDVARRKQIVLHHSAAHLLQAALIKVLGDEVKQAGSQVRENRTRFDFSFSRAMTDTEVADVEDIINNWIWEGLDVTTVEMALEEARKTGAIALFGEKYDDVVRVVTMGKISTELCAGTHAANTRDMGLAKIISESAIAAGTRRIEMVVSKAAFEYFQGAVADEKVKVAELTEKNRELKKELTRANESSAREKFAALAVQAVDSVLITRVDGGDLKIGVETLAKNLDIVVLASNNSVAAAVSAEFIKKGFNAGAIVGEIAKATGANGGGRPNFAQGGVKDASKLEEALREVRKKTTQG
jgi:alanyl-tRNA synthetase